MCLFTLKLLNSIVLLGRACRYVTEYETMRRRMQQMTLARSKSAPATPPLSLLEFNGALYKNRSQINKRNISDVMQQGTIVRGMTLSDVLNDSILRQKLSRSLSSLSHGTEQARISVTGTPIASNSQLTVNVVDTTTAASIGRSVREKERRKAHSYRTGALIATSHIHCRHNAIARQRCIAATGAQSEEETKDRVRV